MGWSGYASCWRGGLSGALKVDRGSDTNPYLLPLESMPLPLGSVSGYRCRLLGAGTSIYCFPATRLTSGKAKKKGAYCFMKG